jgi:hypothetical protein
VAAVDGRQAGGDGGRGDVGHGDQDAADRRERLGVAEDLLALVGVLEQLGEPRHGGDELDADADEHRAAQHQQLLERGDEAGGERREGVEQDAEGQHPAPAQEVGEVAAEQAEHAADHRRDEEQRPCPADVLGAARHP